MLVCKPVWTVAYFIDEIFDEKAEILILFYRFSFDKFWRKHVCDFTLFLFIYML
jgi:hypothetical protein